MWLDDEVLIAWLRTGAAALTSANADAISAANLAAHEAMMSVSGGCGRDFTPTAEDAEASTKIVEADQLLRSNWLIIPDCTEIVSVTGSTTLDAADYRAFASVPGGAYDEIRTRLAIVGDPAWGYFSVTAKWGWPSTPQRVIEATKMLAKECLEYRDVRLGLAGITEVAGVRVRENPFVRSTVKSYQSFATWSVR